MRQDGERIRYLDGLRAVAIGAVLGLHWISQYVPLFLGGTIGVDVFFVLSGYLITSILLRRDVPYPTFVRQRVRRLYPALAGALVVGVGLTLLVPHSPVRPGDALRAAGLALVQVGWLWRSLGLGDMDPFEVTWSLSVEWFFYLLWPLVVVALKRRGTSRRGGITFCLVVAGLCFVASLFQSSAWFYFSPLSRSSELLGGAALAFLLSRPVPVHRVAGPVAMVASLAFIVGFAVLGPAPATISVAGRVVFPLTTIATACLIVGGRALPASVVTRVLSWSPLALIGRTSYSLYLLHEIPVVLLTHQSVPLPRPVLGVLAVGLTVGLTAALYLLLEKPFLRSRSSVLTSAVASVPAGR